jgi:hypothetical protein
LHDARTTLKTLLTKLNKVAIWMWFLATTTKVSWS